MVNALWAGGAEAMMLQDQRVISTSAVRCVGNTLILQGRVYSPPYVITAIGDVQGMRAALDADPAVTIYRQYVDALGLGYDVETRPRSTLPGLRRQPGPRARAEPARERSLRRALGGARRAADHRSACVLLLFVAWQLWWTDVTANARAGRHGRRPSSSDFGAPAPRRPAAARTAAARAPDRACPLGDAFAIIRIPRFGSDYARPVCEGTEPTSSPRASGTTRHRDAGRGRQLRRRRSPGDLRQAVQRHRHARPGDAIVVETRDDLVRLRGAAARDRHARPRRGRRAGPAAPGRSSRPSAG